MSNIKENLDILKGELPENCTLVAVSKFKSADEIMEAYRAGHRDFGENRIQEMVEKHEVLPDDIRWHLIGHIQTNKVKYFTKFVHLVHGVDRRKVLKELNKQAAKDEVVVEYLLQIHIAAEDTKFGLDEEECLALCAEINSGAFPNTKCRGLMGMATNTTDVEIVKGEFLGLKKLHERIVSTYPDWAFDHLSMGMSGDYPLAIASGSNMVRIGSKIFGDRA
ncbi:MAG: YggS family pyridoxal phosphate-dependent enzyme [Cryomorphaceae bacterium]|nr:YggS family pyridoxal phosphate-dependent enzyme [Cryomorphaceae bacterium]